jgi:hypothetical protein
VAFVHRAAKSFAPAHVHAFVTACQRCVLAASQQQGDSEAAALGFCVRRADHCVLRDGTHELTLTALVPGCTAEELLRRRLADGSVALDWACPRADSRASLAVAGADVVAHAVRIYGLPADAHTATPLGDVPAAVLNLCRSLRSHGWDASPVQPQPGDYWHGEWDVAVTHCGARRPPALWPCAGGTGVRRSGSLLPDMVNLVWGADMPPAAPPPPAPGPAGKPRRRMRQRRRASPDAPPRTPAASACAPAADTGSGAAAAAQAALADAACRELPCVAATTQQLPPAPPAADAATAPTAAAAATGSRSARRVAATTTVTAGAAGVQGDTSNTPPPHRPADQRSPAAAAKLQPTTRSTAARPPPPPATPTAAPATARDAASPTRARAPVAASPIARRTRAGAAAAARSGAAAGTPRARAGHGQQPAAASSSPFNFARALTPRAASKAQ